MPADPSWRAVRFAIKHAVAATVVIGGLVLFTAGSYFALLAWAVVAGEGLGGPLAFPFMVVFALVASVIAVILLLMPATAFAEWICARRRLHPLWQIPIATLALAVVVMSLTLLSVIALDSSVDGRLWASGIIFTLLLVPLGAYWWSLQSADWLIRSGARIWTSMRR